VRGRSARIVLLVGDGEGSGLFDDESLAVESSRVGHAVVVSLSGDVDMLTAPQLLPAVEHCITDGECSLLVVDLAEVTFLASSGLGALLDVREFAERHELPFRLVVDENRHVLRPFEITGITNVLTIYRTVDEAFNEPDGDVH
jgi:anti-sigma B factor antagonist